jgi:hypothetical protein
VIFRSKPDDRRFRGYPGARPARRADALDDTRNSRILLEPKYEQQRLEFWRALETIWKQGGWTAYLDELFYLDEQLDLEWPIDRLLTQGRSKGITVVSGMQRPVRVTRFALGESRHVLSFGLEGRDATELGHATNRTFADLVRQLGEHEFAWYRKPGQMWAGKLDVRAGVLNGRRIE